jgi:hypothetical protein
VIARRQWLAPLGIVTILLQAVLFGWHHHAEHFAVAGQWPVLSAPHSGTPLLPAAAEDECELCAALHYLTAAPGEFMSATLPSSAASSLASATTARLPLSANLAFRARAPPSA